MEKEALQKLSARFRNLSRLAMIDSEKQNQARNWIKGEKKEHESNTWLEAHRMCEAVLESLPPPADTHTIKIPKLDLKTGEILPD